MKKLVIGVFSAREDAEKAINRVHNELKIDTKEISYVYKNTDGQVKEVPSDKISSDTPEEGARTGITVGGTLGALAGIATVVGFIPIIGPFVAAGSLATLVGATTAVGTAAVGAAAGAAAGGIIGALINLGVGEEEAQRYSDRVVAGDILVTIHTNKETEVVSILNKCGAIDVDTVKPM